MKILFVLLAFVSVSQADPVSLSNAEAMRLFVAARSTQAGMTAVNAIRLAQNINLLRATAEGYENTLLGLDNKLRAAKASPNLDSIAVAINAEKDKAARDHQTLDLRMVTFTEQEILDAKIPPDSLAEFMRFLDPASKPKTK